MSELIVKLAKYAHRYHPSFNCVFIQDNVFLVSDNTLAFKISGEEVSGEDGEYRVSKGKVVQRSPLVLTPRESVDAIKGMFNNLVPYKPRPTPCHYVLGDLKRVYEVAKIFSPGRPVMLGETSLHASGALAVTINIPSVVIHALLCPQS